MAKTSRKSKGGKKDTKKTEKKKDRKPDKKKKSSSDSGDSDSSTDEADAQLAKAVLATFGLNLGLMFIYHKDCLGLLMCLSSHLFRNCVVAMFRELCLFEACCKHLF